MTHITCRLTAKNRDQLRNPTLGNRVWATFNVNVEFKVTLQEQVRYRGTLKVTVTVCHTAEHYGERVR